MQNSNQSEKFKEGLSFLGKNNIVVLIVAWIIIVTMSLVWNFIKIKEHTLESLRTHARTAFDKDVTYRKWNAQHGGVYVPMTEETPANPHLDVAEKVIDTPLGKTLTMINPAYMTRQIHEIEKQATGIRGHITSLNPIRPKNVADEWETLALEQFEGGMEEVSGVELFEGTPHLRFMRPLVTKKGCLKCHAKQGYKEGDVRGGISISVPLVRLKGTSRSALISVLLGHLLFIILGTLGLIIFSRDLLLKSRKISEDQKKISKYELHREFTSTVSHELRTPVASAKSAVDLVLSTASGDLNGDQKKFLTKAKNNIERLNRLINNFLDLTKLELGKIELKSSPSNIIEAINEVVDIQESVAKKNGLYVQKDIPTESIQAYFDVDKFHQVLNNLITNAIKFTESGGITVSCINHEDKDHVEIAVKDTGKGIGKEDLPKLFEKFQQIGDSIEHANGIGLGLAICKEVVERQGGKIWVESEIGKGSTFHFTLPTKGNDKA